MSLFSLEGPSGYPSQLQIIKQTFLEVTFQWKELACYERNGPITGYHYRVYYDLHHFDEGEVDKNTTMVTLFHRCMKSFTVAAANEAGIGEYCPPLLVPDVNEGNEIVCISLV